MSLCADLMAGLSRGSGGEEGEDQDNNSANTEANGSAPGAHGTEGKARHRQHRTSESEHSEPKYTQQELEGVRRSAIGQVVGIFRALNSVEVLQYFEFLLFLFLMSCKLGHVL